MIWLITLGGFVLGCLVTYALVQESSDDDSDQNDSGQDKES